MKKQNNYCFLFREVEEYKSEIEIAKSVLDFPVHIYRGEVPEYSIVVGRYSVLPFYKELENELKRKSSRLINSYNTHDFIASMGYISHLEGLTPDTFFNWYDLPEGSYIVKGKTNSRKHQWNRQMFAKTREDVSKIVDKALDDTFIREQGVVVRKFEKLTTYTEAINGLPITNEWRFFCYNQEIIDYGYYWANFPEFKPYEKCDLPNKALELVKKAQNILYNLGFYVIDIGEKENGDWTIIELNDGQMSGLSMIDPKEFYEKFNIILKNEQSNTSNQVF